MNKINHTKKEIKTIKKNIVENGVEFYGFYYSIKKVLQYDEIIEAVVELNNNGIDLLKLSETEQDDVIVYEVLKQSNYQDFKNRFLDYIIGS